MNPYLLTERLKTNRLFVRKASIYISLISAIIIFILSTNYLYVHLFSWWYTIVIPIITSYTCNLLSNIDKNKHSNLKPLPIDLSKIWFAKIRIGSTYLLYSCSILIAVFLCFKFIIGDNYPNISYHKGIGFGIILYICSLWQMPLFLFIAYNTNLFYTLLTGILFNTIIGTIIASTNYWFLYPCSYLSKLGLYILNINPSGLFEKDIDISDYFIEISSCIIISIALFVLLSRQTSKWYMKREVQ